MKRILALIFSLTLPMAAFCSEEDQLLAVLHSNQSLREKDAACEQLKRAGTPNCIPAMADLLTNDDLAPTARNVLESMPGPAAEEALIEALAKTSGSNLVGVINSLNTRADSAAVIELEKYVSSSDLEVAVATAKALGAIGGDEARLALHSAWGNMTAGPAHAAQSYALLACANQLLASRSEEKALALFQELYDREKDAGLRVAAYRGVILASGKNGVDLMLRGIAGNDMDSQGAALSLAAKFPGRDVTKSLASLLPVVTSPVQISLIQCLGQRGDRVAEDGVAEMLGNSDGDVRLAALTALGDIGDGKVALPIAQRAALASGAEKTAAREALVDLRQGSVTPYFLRALGTTNGDVQAELIRALGARGDSAAAPKILELARTGDDSTRAVSLQALALVAGPGEFPGLVQMTVRATNDDVRSDIADALTTACQRLQAQKQPLNATDLALAIHTAPIGARVALLEVCGGVSDARIREVLRAAMKDSNPTVRTAAKRAVCNSQDEQLLPDMLQLACGAKEENFRILGIGGCVRLITQDQGAQIPAARKIDALKAILGTPLNVQGKRLILSALATVPSVGALDLASGMVGDEEVKVEAAQAVVQIARSVSTKNPHEAAAALHKVLDAGPGAGVRKMAQGVLKNIKAD